MTKQELVKSELSKLSQVEFGEDEAIILCPFHDDHNPSLRVSLITKNRRKANGVVKKITPGNFYCFSCGAGGGWNNLATKLNLQEWDAKEAENTPQDQFWGISRDLEALNQQIPQYTKPATEGPWEESWRGLSVKFLQQHGAEALWDRIDEQYRIYLPAIDLDQTLVGHIGARPDNSTIPDKRKYINSYAFPSETIWYCLNYSIGSDKLVICEGPYDTLRLRAEGFPAIGALGVSTLTELKVMKILSIGCQKILLCLDGDRAGREAVGLFTKEFRKYGITVADMDLTQYRSSPGQKIDPGNAPQEALNDMREFLKNF